MVVNILAAAMVVILAYNAMLLYFKIDLMIRWKKLCEQTRLSVDNEGTNKANDTDDTSNEAKPK